MTKIRTTMLATFVLAACGGSEPDEGGLTESTRAQLHWKRNVALERDLMRALDLAQDQVCREFGRASCTREVHHVALGGAAPFTLGLHRPLPDPMLSTAVVVDRLLLNACATRAALDREGPPVVFTDLDLSSAVAPDAGDDAFAATVTTLYRRFLSRDSTPAEVAVLRDLTLPVDGKAPSAYDFAILSCYAVGTTTEFLFY